MAKVGDKITTIGKSLCCFKDGDKAVLFSQDPDGDWWADFTGNESYCGDGVWCIGLIDEGFKLDNS